MLFLELKNINNIIFIFLIDLRNYIFKKVKIKNLRCNAEIGLYFNDYR